MLEFSFSIHLGLCSSSCLSSIIKPLIVVNENKVSLYPYSVILDHILQNKAVFSS